MRGNVCLQAAVFVVVLFCGPSGESLSTGSIGLTQAQATEFYSRKRVNGVWVNGRFKRKHSASAHTRRNDARPVRTAEGPKPVTKPAATDTQPAIAPQPPVAMAARPVANTAPQDDYMLRLREGLEARAKVMAEDGLPPFPPPVRLITLDYATNLRTIIYIDGSVMEEPFDPTSTGAVGLKP